MNGNNIILYYIMSTVGRVKNPLNFLSSGIMERLGSIQENLSESELEPEPEPELEHISEGEPYESGQFTPNEMIPDLSFSTKETSQILHNYMYHPIKNLNKINKDILFKAASS